MKDERKRLVVDLREAPFYDVKYIRQMQNLDARTEILVGERVSLTVIKPTAVLSAPERKGRTADAAFYETHEITLDRREACRGNEGLVDVVLRTHPALKSSVERYAEAWSECKAGQNAQDFLADTCGRRRPSRTCVHAAVVRGSRWDDDNGYRPRREHGNGNGNVLASKLVRALYFECWFALTALLADVLVRYAWRPHGPNVQRLLALADERK